MQFVTKTSLEAVYVQEGSCKKKCNHPNATHQCALTCLPCFCQAVQHGLPGAYVVPQSPGGRAPKVSMQALRRDELGQVFMEVAAQDLHGFQEQGQMTRLG